MAGLRAYSSLVSINVFKNKQTKGIKKCCKKFKKYILYNSPSEKKILNKVVNVKKLLATVNLRHKLELL